MPFRVRSVWWRRRPAPLRGRRVGELWRISTTTPSISSVGREGQVLTATSGVGERLRLSEPSSTSAGSCRGDSRHQHNALGCGSRGEPSTATWDWTGRGFSSRHVSSLASSRLVSRLHSCCSAARAGEESRDAHAFVGFGARRRATLALAQAQALALSCAHLDGTLRLALARARRGA